MKGWLVLETGEVYQGAWHGGENRAGEVVFNTSHSGYEEIATDPSYFSQIVVMTAPMQGNYGIEDEAWESRQLWIEGFICLEVQDSERDQAWKKRLIENKIPMLTELDTRHLVLRLRKGGTPWGALVQAADQNQAKAIAQDLISKKKTLDKDWVYLASRPAPEVRRGENMVGPRVAVLDFGSKENILRELQNRCSEIKIFNSRSSVQEIMDYNPDGIMLTNGPGDPADVKVAIGTVKELLGVKPIFGICMGHQILGLALGGKTYKLKFGHRGSNHPIQDQILNQIYMTSQNHGYAVDPATLPDDVKVTHTNLNDGTVAGFYSEKRKCLGIQYHPESCPGPHEASGLFSYFVERMI
ncbi:glutamine-hydrolyzing carbamoyl-phosphate synthase small subunit [Bdellovibrio sp. HCB274]|uniref:glutamine-hydrolyzing carbamoyl-phosphate synthase small subunit n=1 Tax=Bdellovibrio sp. HCB274 TaxID=3394361 RepID=UPI0039B5A87E